MVKGFEKFEKFFKDYTESYIIIGGTACEYYEEKLPTMKSRATKDIDVIIIVEAFTSEFVKMFWKFIQNGNYQNNVTGAAREQGKKSQFYRFKDPEDETFPKQIELFSRRRDILIGPETHDIRIIRLKTTDEVYSLSAILMSDAYYDYVVNNGVVANNIHYASKEGLICLKCKAYIEMLRMKKSGEQVDQRDINKHKNDVFRMLVALDADNYNIKRSMPTEIKSDLKQFCDIVKETDMPNDSFIKSMKSKKSAEQLLEFMKKCFEL